jgi:5-hydroxyisourate hydrolase-like protein (transthyretin family)
MKSIFKHILIIGLIAATATGNVFGQKKQKKKARVQVEYIKNYNKSEQLMATLIVKEKRYVPLSDAVIQFYSLNDTSRVLLEKMRTDKDGKAMFNIAASNPKIFKDTSGVLTFEVEYNGNSAIKGAKRKIAIKQGDLEISFFQKDSIKSIEVNATEIGADDQLIPIEGVNILFYVQGTFSLLNFGKEKTDENGIVHIGFPIDMPGDTTGVLTIVTKIEEDKTFGTVESRGEINWGVPIQPVKEKQRGLGDTDAPLWMVYTLITLLSAVWFHYIYVIFLIVKIKLAE